MNEIFEKYESNVRSYCRKWPVEFVSAKGSIIKDKEGNEYIDFFDGAGALNYGHNNEYIREKLVNYLMSDGIVHSLDMYATPKKEFIETLQEKVLQPKGLDYKIMFPGPTGTNGIEMAIKLARKVKGSSNIFAFSGAFHGMTLGSLALTTEEQARKGAGVELNNVTHIPAPYYLNGNFDTIGYLEEMLRDDHSGIEKPAAIILETVQAEGGINVFSKEFLQKLRKLCDDFDILLIADEVQIGCCRTGDFYSFERADIVPDIVVQSKSIGGYGFPLSIVLIKKELDKFLPGEHNGTFRGFQPSMVTAKAGLEFMLDNNIEEETKRKGKLVEEYLEKEIRPLLTDEQDIRGLGLIWGIDFKDGKLSRAVLDECFRNKLIIELAGRGDSVLKIMPALTIPDETLYNGLDIIKDATKNKNVRVRK